MSRTNSLLDQYERAIDEIVAACDGDLRAALPALMFMNEQLEQRHGANEVHPSRQRLH
jgi:hypothetical protein